LLALVSAAEVQIQCGKKVKKGKKVPKRYKSP
jgi:hypothetical protein